VTLVHVLAPVLATSCGLLVPPPVGAASPLVVSPTADGGCRLVWFAWPPPPSPRALSLFFVAALVLAITCGLLAQPPDGAAFLSPRGAAT